MSKRSDMLVIGGGVIGLTCAWRMAQEGLAVTVVEREVCGSAGSNASLGALMPSPATRHAPFQMLQRQSLWMFEAFADELREETGIDVGFERCGLLEMMHCAQRLTQAEFEVRNAASEWPPLIEEPVMELLSREVAHRLEPQVHIPPLGVRLCRASAQVDVDRLLEALRAACLRHGVVLKDGHRVTELLLAEEGARGVRCGDQVIESGAVLAAAGAWNSKLSPVLEACAPVRPAKGQAMLLASDACKLDHIIKRQTIYLLPRPGGRILLGSTTEHDAGFDQRNTASGIATLTTGAVALCPVLAEASIIRMWAGLRPESLGKNPYIGPVPEVGGLFVATGHFKTGVALAPITGRIIADLVVGRETVCDVAPFAPKLVQTMT